MLGRRAAFAAVLTSAAVFSGGVAVAATHNSPQKLQPPKLLPMKQPAVTNWHLTHHYCHKSSSISASL